MISRDDYQPVLLTGYDIGSRVQSGHDLPDVCINTLERRIVLRAAPTRTVAGRVDIIEVEKNRVWVAMPEEFDRSLADLGVLCRRRQAGKLSLQIGVRIGQDLLVNRFPTDNRRRVARCVVVFDIFEEMWVVLKLAASKAVIDDAMMGG